MKTAPTAEQLISKLIGLEAILRNAGVFEDVVERINVHAKNHTQIALEEAESNAKIQFYTTLGGPPITLSKPRIDSDSILNAYPLTNIK